MAVVRNLLVRAGADFSAMRRSMQQAQKDLNNFKNHINKTMRGITTVLATVGVSFGIGAAVREAMQFEAALQQINRLMGENASQFQRWANEQAAAFGMARSEAVRYGAVYANLISGFSRSTAEVAQRTEDLLRASAVIASSTGRTMDDVMERIRSGLLGNTEAIEDLGVNVNIAMIESTKAFRDFAGDRSWEQLDFQTQQTIRYFAILEQAAAKYGVELAQNTASRQAAFVAQLKNAQLALGQAFLPIYNVILPALTRFATALANTMNTIAQFVQALFGYDQAKQQTEATEAQAGAVSDLGNAYEKAGKQAKRAVAGFDQLNILSSGAAGGGAGAAASVIPAEMTTGGPLSKFGETMSEVSQKAREMGARVREAFGNLAQFIRQNSDIIIAALAGIGAAFITHFVTTNWTTIIGTITTALKGLRTTLITTWTAAMGPMGIILTIIGLLTAAFVYFYRTNETFRGVVDGILQKIGDVALWLWNNVMAPFGKFLQSVMVSAWNGVTIAAQWYWKNALVPLGNALLWLWNNVLVPVGAVLRDVLGTAFQFVADIALSFWQNVVIPLGSALREMLAPAVEAVSAVLNFLWKNVLVPLGTFLGSLIAGVLTDLINTFTFLWQKVLKPLTQFVGGVLKIVFENTFIAIGDVIDGLKTSLIGILNFITGTFTADWGKAWEGVKKIFKGVFDALVGIAKAPLNMIIDAINKLISGLNKFSIDIPDWVSDIVGVRAGKFGFNIPKIPRLAMGGLAYGPTLAVVGDNRNARIDPEVIAPLSKLENMMGGSDNREILSALRRVEQAVRDLKFIQAVIERDMIGMAAADYINDERRRGRNPLLAP